jgi:hypothetical protein
MMRMERMDAMKVVQRNGTNQENDSDDELEVKIIRKEPEEQVILEEKIIKAIIVIGGWIGEMKKYLEFQQIKYLMMVRIACTRLKISASL